MKNKLLIAADCIIDSDFINILERELQAEVELFYIDSTDEKRINRITRHLSYFLIAIKAFIFRKKYKYIIFWQQFMGLYYGILSNIFFWIRKFPAAIVLHLIYKPRGGLIGKVHETFFCAVLNSRSLNRFICHSSQERELYLNLFGQKYQNKVFFVKHGLNLPKRVIEMGEKVGDYFFSGGTSNRDYKTLIKAFKELNQQLILVCFPKDIENLEIPPNVKVLHGIFGIDFLQYVKNAYAVIITLENPDISSGHLVLLGAMNLAKPIIVTKCAGIEDYVDEQCAIFVEHHSSAAVRNIVQKLMEDKRKSKLFAEAGFLRYQSEFTLEKYGKRIVNILRNV